jgi:hypothetical protein
MANQFGAEHRAALAVAQVIEGSSCPVRYLHRSGEPASVAADIDALEGGRLSRPMAPGLPGRSRTTSNGRVHTRANTSVPFVARSIWASPSASPRTRPPA